MSMFDLLISLQDIQSRLCSLIRMQDSQEKQRV